MIETAFALLVLFQFKHFVADYVLQAPSFFVGKFRDDWGFLVPMLVHVGIHAVFTFALCKAFGASVQLATRLACFDAGVHFAMDRLKAGKRYFGRWKALSGSEWMEAKEECERWEESRGSAWRKNADEWVRARRRLRGNILFWQALGLDQMVHHLTDYAVIWWLVSR